jgi:hypothetical protein
MNLIYMPTRGALLLLLLLPACVMCQDSSIVKWKAIKKGKDPTNISLIITAEIKKGFYIHPCEDCSVNSWNDNKPRTYINISADSNWKVTQVFDKTKSKQWIRFNKVPRPATKMVMKGTDTTYEHYTETDYLVDCRVYNGMKVYRGIELAPSEGAVARFNLSLPPLPDDAKEGKRKKRDKVQKDATKILLKTLPPPNDLIITISYQMVSQNVVQTLIVPNTYKSKKKWGWKKTPRPILNKD